MYFHVNFYVPISCNWTSGKMLINIRVRKKTVKKYRTTNPSLLRSQKQLCNYILQGAEHTQIQVCILKVSTHTYKQGFADICWLYHKIFQGRCCSLCYSACNIAADHPPKKGPWEEAEIGTVCVAGDISETQLLFTVFLFPIKLQSPPIKHEQAFLWAWDRVNTRARTTSSSAAMPGQSSAKILLQPHLQQNIWPMKKKTLFKIPGHKASLGIYLCTKLK